MKNQWHIVDCIDSTVQVFQTYKGASNFIMSHVAGSYKIKQYNEVNDEGNTYEEQRITDLVERLGGS